MILFCPHCNDIVEIFGEPRVLECETCNAVLEKVCDIDSARAFKSAFDAAFRGPGQGEAPGHPAVARRLTADFDKQFPVER